MGTLKSRATSLFLSFSFGAAAFLGAGCGPTQTITHSIVDPNDLKSITKFQSCCHLEYKAGSGSSHKHYLQPSAANAGKDGAIKVYSPCDGRISDNKDKLEGCSGGAIRGSDLFINCKANPNDQVVLFHVTPLEGIDKGTQLKAGQQVGTAALSCPDGFQGADFDLGYYKGGEPDSLFTHMNDAALAPWAAKNVTRENTTATRSGSCADFSDASCAADTIVF